MLNIRQKEIANAKKQIDYNKVQISKLSTILEKLGINPTASPGTTETVPSQWEQKYKEELQKKADLEKAIHQLEKQNKNQGNAVDRVPNTEE